ncbi:hypothetical protein [Lactococcus taiwanensis]|uniref:hypothetical protein n=1 Tax=Lactococcus taiwanensis TaxID=1151742 RepID=UPI0028A62041|nr:hypothetical protein [Lactococcus taiwanensis]
MAINQINTQNMTADINDEGITGAFVSADFQENGMLILRVDVNNPTLFFSKDELKTELSSVINVALDKSKQLQATYVGINPEAE